MNRTRLLTCTIGLVASSQLVRAEAGPQASQPQLFAGNRIVASAARPKHPGNCGWERGRAYTRFTASAATLQRVLAEVLDVAAQQIRVDPAVADGRWDIEFAESYVAGQKRTMPQLVAALRREAKVTVVETKEMQEVWVARHEGSEPPAADGHRTSMDPKAGTMTHNGVGTRAIIMMFEEQAGAPIVDETGLNGRYKWEFSTENQNSFEATQEEFKKKFGITLTKEKREMPVFTVSPEGEKTKTSSE